MNQGLHGFAMPQPPQARRVKAVQVAVASATYAAGASEPTSDTTVKDDSGSTTLAVTLTLDQRSTVLVRFTARATKSTNSGGRSRVRLYDNAAQVWPAAPSSTLTNWYGRSAGANSLHQFDCEAVLTLEAGVHVLDVRHQAAFTTAAITWGDRAIVATVLEGPAVPMVA